MFENIKNIFKRAKKKELLKSSSKDTAKERLHLVLMQDRANVSVDFLDLMRREIIEVIKKYIDIDEEAMDVRLTTETNEDGMQGIPALYANIPIVNIKDETRKLSKTNVQNKLDMTFIEKEDRKQKDKNIKQDNINEIKEENKEKIKKKENEINKNNINKEENKQEQKELKQKKENNINKEKQEEKVIHEIKEEQQEQKEIKNSEEEKKFNTKESKKEIKEEKKNEK